MQKEKILIVEDEMILAMELEMRLQDEEFNNIKCTSTGKEAVELATSFKPDVILMDIMLNGVINGIEAAQLILEFKKIPIIYITGNDHLRKDEQLLATKPVAILGKPLSDWELFEAISKALKK
ncbi:MAG: response regulator [Candidatus Neomarinimicrobiota bacterium]|nr:MAG: response regulator [Candidatus Neomarinimicrobiota bacterium]